MRRKPKSNDSEVVKDGQVVRVPMMFRDEDGLPGRVFRDTDGEVEAADWQIGYVRDCKVAHGFSLEDGEALHRPGFRFCDAAGHEAKAKAYLQAVQDAENAWRTPPAESLSAVGGFGSHGFIGGQPGDLCTVGGPEYPLDEGSSGHLKMVNGELVCVPDQSREDARSNMDARDAAYQDYVRDLTEAWRGK